MAHPANERLDRWLAQETPEAVLEPELPIVDPHHHLWDHRPVSSLLAMFEQKLFLCEEMSEEIATSGHRVVQTVFAQCLAFHRADGPAELRPVGETEFANGVAAMSRSGVYGPARLCAGIFSSADLRLGKDVEPVLRAHIAASPNFRGVRFFGSLPRDGESAFLEGCAVLASHGLSLDHYSPEGEHSRDLVKIADAHPDLTIVANHLAGRIDPEAGDGEFDVWRARIDAIASRANIVMKLGGAQMRVGAWEPPFHMNRRATPIGSEELSETLYRWYHHALTAFGPERCMFESNFPVDRECVSYRTLWNTFKRIAAKAGLGAAQKAAVFAGTAARAYRLALDPD
jgi:predicted TIM-barrel fold metal-dependent hydrolase